MKRSWLVLLSCIVVLASLGCGRSKHAAHEVFVPVAAPEVPPAIHRHRPAQVIVDLEVVETVARVADNVEVILATYGGSVPGPFVRVREGDQVEFRLHNHPDNQQEYSLQVLAAIGPGAGSEASLTPPGFSSSLSFHARTPGLFLYGSPLDHLGVDGGLFGLILVEPQGGLPPVQNEIFLIRSEFYTEGPAWTPGVHALSLDKAQRGMPEYVVFNGAVDALNGERALSAEVWQSMRLYIGNAGPSLMSSLRILGQPFERVYLESGLQPVTGRQSLSLPPGSAAIVDVLWEVPGIFPLVDISYGHGHGRGALAEIYVTGPENPALFAGSKPLEEYQPGTRLAALPEPTIVEVEPLPVAVSVPTAPAVPDVESPAPVAEAAPIAVPAEPALALDPTPAPVAPAPAEPEYDLAGSIARGQETYQNICMVCHQANGMGLPGIFPPLAGSDYLFDDIDRAIHIVLNGKQGVILVNGVEYNQVMVAQNLDDEQTADVMNYILNTWGNEHDETITPARVARVRAGEAAPAAAPAAVDAAPMPAPVAAPAPVPAPEPTGMLIEIPVEPDLELDVEPEPAPEAAEVPPAVEEESAVSIVVPVPDYASLPETAPAAERAPLVITLPGPEERMAAAPEPVAEPAPAEAWMSLEESMQIGQTVYMRLCFACHQANGQGIPGIFPPLANSDYLLEDVDRAINVVLRGLQGEIVVNGVTYNQVMPPQDLDNFETAHVLNYILNSWGNSAPEMVTPDWVGRIRATPPAE